MPFLKTKAIFFLLSFLASFCAIQAQDVFDFPAEKQFFQRNSNNQSVVHFSSSLQDSQPDSIKVLLFKDEVFVFNQIYLGSVISDSVSIDAGLFKYSFKVFSYKNGIERLIHQAQNMLCGDTYLIYGQSNAVAYCCDEALTPEVDFSFIYNFVYLTDGDINNGWHPANFYVSYPGTVGIWFAKNIVEKNKMPVQLINGSIGGKPIQELAFRDALDPFNRGNYYGDFISRIKKAKVPKVAGLIFLQGEFESYSGNQSLVQGYKNLLVSLFDNFPKDLNFDIEDIFLVQTNIGNDLNTGNSAIQIRDFQRQVADSLENVHAFASLDLPMSNDGVHYAFEGYREIATDLALAANYFIYKKGNGISVSGPLIKEIQHINRDHKISLVFDPKQLLVLNQKLDFGLYTRYLKDVFFDQNNLVFVDSVSVDRNVINLYYKGLRNISHVTYLPGAFNDDFSNNYNGPLIKNTSGMPALSFRNIEVKELMNEECINPPALRPESIVKVYDHIYLNFSDDELEFLKDNLLEIITLSQENLSYSFNEHSIVIDYEDIPLKNLEVLNVTLYLSSYYCEDVQIEMPLGVCRNVIPRKIAFKGYGEVDGCSIVLKKLINQTPIHLKSQSFILLEPGFSTESSGVFTAEIVP